MFRIIFFATLIILLNSCADLLVKDLELDEIEFEQKMVINANINSFSDSLAVMVSENKSVLDQSNEINLLEDVILELFYEDEKIADLEKGEDGRYYHFFPDNQRPVGTYELKAENEKYKDVSARTTIPEDVPISELEYIPNAGLSPVYQDTSYAFQIKFQDPPGKNYYSFELFSDYVVRDTFIFQSDTIIDEYELYFDFDFTDPNIQTIQDGTALLNDETFDGKEHVLFVRFFVYNREISRETLRDYLKLSWEVLSEDFYNYRTSLQLYYESSGFDLFSEPVTLHSNVENGYGIFAGVNRKIYDF